VVKHRLKALGLDQKDPATAAQGHRTLHFTIAGAKEGSSSTSRTDIYEKWAGSETPERRAFETGRPAAAGRLRKKIAEAPTGPG